MSGSEFSFLRIGSFYGRQILVPFVTSTLPLLRRHFAKHWVIWKSGEMTADKASVRIQIMHRRNSDQRVINLAVVGSVPSRK